MRVIGLTGGVGAGKSRILSILREDYKAEVIIADEVAHGIMEPGREGYEKIVEVFGPGILETGGKIDKNQLALVMFRDERKVKAVNAVIHPLVWKKIREKIRSATAPLVVVEAAVMEEEPGDIFDEMWYVYTSRENRLKRLSLDRGYPEEKSLSIMGNQASDDKFRALCGRVIDNNGTLERTRAQIAAALKDSETCG